MTSLYYWWHHYRQHNCNDTNTLSRCDILWLMVTSLDIFVMTSSVSGSDYISRLMRTSLDTVWVMKLRQTLFSCVASPQTGARCRWLAVSVCCMCWWCSTADQCDREQLCPWSREEHVRSTQLCQPTGDMVLLNIIAKLPCLSISQRCVVSTGRKSLVSTLTSICGSPALSTTRSASDTLSQTLSASAWHGQTDASICSGIIDLDQYLSTCLSVCLI